MFKKATKSQAKLRAALFGPSGSGKTYSALRIAKGMGGQIALIDTERGSASKYADRFDFDVVDLDDRSVEGYVAMIRAAAKMGYNVLIIDSFSHAWQELLDAHDKIAQTKFKGNSWSAWSVTTPRFRQLIDAVLAYPGHVICTMRSKTEWAQQDDGRGKAKPVRIGLAPEQRGGVEYEFDLLLELTVEHLATIIKDRTGRFQDQMIEKPGEEFGKALAGWLSDGVPVAMASEDAILSITDLIQNTGSDIAKFLAYFGIDDLSSLTAEQADKAVAMLKAKPRVNQPDDSLAPAEAA